ncbi:unnamed protein product [Chrysoparadoxa australica]
MPVPEGPTSRRSRRPRPGGNRHASPRSDGGEAGRSDRSEGDVVEEQEVRRRRRGWGRVCRRTAKRKWKQIGTAGLAMLLLAGFLCMAVYSERWMKVLERRKAANGHTAEAPESETPHFFEGRDIPLMFTEYARAHNALMEAPAFGKYVIYTMPSNVTLAHSLLGLTSTFLFAIMSKRALLVDWSQGPVGQSGMAAGPYTDGQGQAEMTLLDVFQDPGIFWGLDRFKERWEGLFRLDSSVLKWEDVDVVEDFEKLVCNDLRTYKAEHQFIRVVNNNYYSPLLTTNAYGSFTIQNQIPEGQLFSYLSNWLLRPVPAVMNAVRRFKARYFDNNYVIGLEIDLEDNMSEWGVMPVDQQEKFFMEASQESYRVEQGGFSEGGIVVLAVTSNEELLRKRLGALGDNALGSTGVIAIKAPSGYGLERVHSELQVMWLLGYCDTVIVTPASPMGVVGHARTGIRPLVVLDGESSHLSVSAQPCFADVGLIQHASCFLPSMLSVLDYDSKTPCVQGRYSTGDQLGHTRALRIDLGDLAPLAVSPRVWTVGCQQGHSLSL